MEKLNEVIRGLECCQSANMSCSDNCPYFKGYELDGCMDDMMWDALEVLKKLADREGVYPDWYERLSDLGYVYREGEPWYKAEDVWACIEEIPDGHNEFGANMADKGSDTNAEH